MCSSADSRSGTTRTARIRSRYSVLQSASVTGWGPEGTTGLIPPQLNAHGRKRGHGIRQKLWSDRLMHQQSFNRIASSGVLSFAVDRNPVGLGTSASVSMNKWQTPSAWPSTGSGVVLNEPHQLVATARMIRSTSPSRRNSARLSCRVVSNARASALTTESANPSLSASITA